MLRIKLQRVGKKHDPSFRMVVTDRRTGPKSKKHIVQVGHYDAIRKTLTLEKDEIKEWIAKGAKPTDTVHNLLVKEKVIKEKKVNVLPKKSPVVKEVEEERATAPEAPKEEEKPAEEPTEEEKKEE